MKTPTIFFGSSSYVLPVIEYLSKDFDLKLVITTEKDSGIVPQYCAVNSIPCISVFKLDQPLNHKLSAINAPFAVLADFALLVPQSLINLFPKGIINIHPSLLPLYRGPTPGLSALLNGELTTGISIMLLDKDLDHGPLIGQISLPIKPNDTSATLYPRLFEEAAELLKKILPEYLEGKIQPKEQDHTKATYTLPHLTRESGFINFHEVITIDPQLFDRKVRAFFPWPSLWTKYTKEGRLSGKIIKFLPEGKIQVEGKKPQSYKDFLNGYPEEKEWVEKISGAK